MAIFALRNGKRTLVFKKTRLADSSFKRFKGLMFEKTENLDYALVFHLPVQGRLEASIHMMFMNFPIDAVFLDSERRIVDIAQGLRPWVLNFTPKKPAKYIIEMPAGIAKKYSLRIGEKLFFD